MRSKYDLKTIANILLDKDVEREEAMLSTMQRDYLELSIEELDIANKNALMRDDYESTEGFNALAKLKRNPKLMVILDLSNMPISDLIDVLACYVTGDFEPRIIEKEEGFCLELNCESEVEEHIISKTPAVDEFLDAKVHHGPFREESDLMIDSRGNMLEPIYGKLLKEKNERFYQARYLDLYTDQIKRISLSEDGFTNRKLLEFFVKNEDLITGPFIPEDFGRIASYFTYWLGETFRFYADLDSK